MTNKPYEVIMLDNGITLVLQNIKYFNSISLVTAIGAGPKYETNQTSGLAHFLEHMLFEGTKKHPTSKKLAEYLENAGGKSGAWTEKEYVTYYIKITKGKLGKAFSYLEDVLFNSVLNDEAIEKEKGIVLEEYNRGIDNPEFDIWDNWLEWTWGKNQWLGRSTLGNEENIKNITKAKLTDYLKKLYIPSNMVISVVGNFSIKEAKELAIKYFGNKKGEELNLSSEIKYKPKNKFTKIIKFKTNQNQLMLGFITGASYDNQDRYVLRVIADILSTGVSSRIFNKLVYGMGIAYSAGATAWSLFDTGLFLIYGGFSPKNTEKAIKVILEEINKLKKNKITNKELKDAKIKDKAQLHFLLETPDALANMYATQLITERRITTPDEIINKINLVSPNDIQRVANKYFSRKNISLTIRGSMNENQSNIYDNLIKKLDE